MVKFLMQTFDYTKVVGSLKRTLFTKHICILRVNKVHYIAVSHTHSLKFNTLLQYNLKFKKKKKKKKHAFYFNWKAGLTGYS